MPIRAPWHVFIVAMNAFVHALRSPLGRSVFANVRPAVHSTSPWLCASFAADRSFQTAAWLNCLFARRFVTTTVSFCAHSQPFTIPSVTRRQCNNKDGSNATSKMLQQATAMADIGGAAMVIHLGSLLMPAFGGGAGRGARRR